MANGIFKAEEEKKDRPVVRPVLTEDKYVADGNAFLAKGQYDKAIESYRFALNAQGKYKFKNPEAYLGTGMAYLSKGWQWNADAERAFMGALEIEPKNAKAHLMLGDILLMRGSMGMAKQQYAAAVKSDIYSAQNHLKTSQLLANHEDARRELEEMIKTAKKAKA